MTPKPNTVKSIKAEIFQCEDSSDALANPHASLENRTREK